MDNLCNVTTDRARFSYVHLFKLLRLQNRKASLKNGMACVRRSLPHQFTTETE